MALRYRRRDMMLWRRFKGNMLKCYRKKPMFVKQYLIYVAIQTVGSSLQGEIIKIGVFVHLGGGLGSVLKGDAFK